jgi:hypothetical protein
MLKVIEKQASMEANEELCRWMRSRARAPGGC